MQNTQNYKNSLRKHRIKATWLQILWWALKYKPHSIIPEEIIYKLDLKASAKTL